MQWPTKAFHNQLYGGEPFVLRPELYDEKIPTGKTGMILCLRSVHKANSSFVIQTLPVFLVVIFSSLARPYQASRFWAVLGGSKLEKYF